MNVIISISGQGVVSGQGEYRIGDTVTLSATPKSSSQFRDFNMGENVIITDNPYSFEVLNDEDITIKTSFYMPIETYIRNMVGFDVPDGIIENILLDRGLTFGADSNNVSFADKQLSFADLLMWASTQPSSSGGAKDSDGGWSHTEATQSLSTTDRKEMRRTAMLIYRRFDPTRYEASIRIVSLIGRPYVRR